ncbi:MAG TPA: hypothetical protein VFL59_03400 [Candidatus Nanopelagicales bacterium]|nr:hypothetical protein [Candidatus Nanopelagicales bacterium]
MRPIVRRAWWPAALATALALVVPPSSALASVRPAAAADLAVHATIPSPFDPVWLTRTGWQSVDVTNTGADAVVIPAATFSDGGAHPADWTVTDGCAGTLASGAQCVVWIDYAPAQAWSGTATLTLNGVGTAGSTVLHWPVAAMADDRPPVMMVPPIGPFAVPSAFYDAVSAGYRDDETTEGTEDVRVRLAGPGASALGSWVYPRAWQDARWGYGAGWLAYGLLIGNLSRGTTECFSYRARDQIGNVSAWTAPRCTSLMWDDRSAKPVRGWTRGTGSSVSYDGGTWTRATARGATLVGPTVTSRRIGILATTCPTCGAVDVFVGTTRVGVLSTRGPMKHRVLLVLPARSTAVRGTIRLVVRTSGQPVIVDGVGTRIV